MSETKQYIVRILTEDVNRNGVKRLLRGLRVDYTMLFGHGSWLGEPEKSLVIELTNTSAARTRQIATAIKVLNKQEAVLVQRIATCNEIIGGSNE
jgi:hypothetical protein